MPRTASQIFSKELKLNDDDHTRAQPFAFFLEETQLFFVHMSGKLLLLLVIIVIFEFLTSGVVVKCICVLAHCDLRFIVFVTVAMIFCIYSSLFMAELPIWTVGFSDAFCWFHRMLLCDCQSFQNRRSCKRCDCPSSFMFLFMSISVSGFCSCFIVSCISSLLFCIVSSFRTLLTFLCCQCYLTAMICHGLQVRIWHTCVHKGYCDTKHKHARNIMIRMPAITSLGVSLFMAYATLKIYI